MTTELFGAQKNIARITTDAVIADAGAALDAAMSVQYETGCERLIFDQSAFAKPFFILSSGLAGEILQKFINYRIKVAIVGDYSGYTSKPLRDFIRESNRGNDVFFVGTVDEAVQKLSAAR